MESKEKTSEKKTGMLYLCATPIGNLEDITTRVVRTLKEADLIAAEDTRNSLKLLNYFDIHTPLTSYHEYNRIEKGKELIEKMHAGARVALITDAGTPAISDPGEDLVRMAMEEGIPVTAMPGACACITALTVSGLPTRRFCFEAFLPTEKKERGQILEELRTETRTIVLYEAPHRLVRTLKDLFEVLGNRRVTLCRELTKKHESILATTLQGALSCYQEEDPRGEYVLVIEGRSRDEMEREEQESWGSLTISEHVALYESQGLDRKGAMKQAAKDRGLTKREIYDALLSSDEGN